MNTTAVFAEILVIGLQATVWLSFAALTLTGVSWIDRETIRELTDWSALIAALALGLAYTLGIAIDRVADSLLHPFDRSIRDRRLPPDLPSVPKMRLEVLARHDKVAEFLDYIRSRMRIARSTVLNLALTTVAAALFLAVRTAVGACAIVAVVLAGLALTLVFCFAWRRISWTYYKRLTQAYELTLRQPKATGS